MMAQSIMTKLDKSKNDDTRCHSPTYCRANPFVLLEMLLETLLEALLPAPLQASQPAVP
jgi:hypothetical protein